MEFEPISTARLVALMIAGGIFAAAGLYMMLRPKPQGSAKIELFGLKFESSSAGLLVFLIGAAFLSVTLFVPEAKTITATPQPGQIQPPGDAPPGLVPVQASSTEVEPNDTVHAANLLPRGTPVAGKVRSDEVDWYVIDTSQQDGQRLIVTLRHIAGSDVYGEIFDTDEQRKDQIGWVATGAKLGNWVVSGERAFVKVVGTYLPDKTTRYEIVTRFEEP